MCQIENRGFIFYFIQYIQDFDMSQYLFKSFPDPRLKSYNRYSIDT